MDTKLEEALILIESNTSGTGKIFANLAYAKNLKVILITQGFVNYNFDEHVQKCEVEIFDLKSLSLVITKLFRKYRILGITSTSDYYLEIAARLAKKFDLPHPCLETILKCRNKFVFRKLLQNEGFTVPCFKVIKNIKDLYLFEVDSELNYPLVLKPIYGSGSVDVKLVANRNELITHGKKLLERTVNERNQKINNSFLIEEFIDGEEFSVELFDGKIVGITKKYKCKLPYFVEVGHDFPHNMDKKLSRNIAKNLEELKTTLNLEWGAFHLEFIDKEGEIIFIEINPRLAGGFIPLLIDESYGIDLIRNLLFKVIGKQTNVEKSKKLFSCIRFIIPNNPHYIENDFNSVDFQNYKSFKELKIYKRSFMNFKRRFDFRDRAGHVITVSSDLDIARKEASKILKHIKKEIFV